MFDWKEQMFDFVDHWVVDSQNIMAPNLISREFTCINFAGFFFFEEILEAFPDCKVILSEREEGSWI